MPHRQYFIHVMALYFRVGELGCLLQVVLYSIQSCSFELIIFQNTDFQSRFFLMPSKKGSNCIECARADVGGFLWKDMYYQQG